MVGRLYDIIPDAEDLLRLKPEGLGGAILETLLGEEWPHCQNYIARVFSDCGLLAGIYPP